MHLQRDFDIIIIGCGGFDIIIIGCGGFNDFYKWEEAKKSLFESPRICLSTSLYVERLSVSSLRSFCSKNLSTSSSLLGGGFDFAIGERRLSVSS